MKRKESTSIMRAVLQFFSVGFTVLLCVVIFLNVREFKEVIRSTACDHKLQHALNLTSDVKQNPIVLMNAGHEIFAGDRASVSVQGTRIFVNCTCPYNVSGPPQSASSINGVPTEGGITACPKEEGVALKSEGTVQNRTEFSLLIGILTRADLYDRRHFLRLVYGIQSSPYAKVDVKFVFCNLTKEDQRILVALEIMRFNDIIILDCQENMNSGKTYTYFSSLPKMGIQYDYVMKADDDVYFRVDKLAESLRPLPREDLYYGFVIPCDSHNPFVHYMSGMGFVLSWDLVQWIETSPIPKNKTEGPEDKMVGIWLNDGKKAKNRVSNKPAMYDYPGMNGKCSHDLIPDTIAVHRLKNRDKWFDVLQFFNVTSALNESKLYHLH